MQPKRAAKEGGNLDPERDIREQLERRVVEKFNAVRKAGCTTLKQFEMRQQERRNGGRWGSVNEFRVNSRGVMVNGLGQPVEERDGKLQPVAVGFGRIFENRSLMEGLDEIVRARRAAGGEING